MILKLTAFAFWKREMHKLQCIFPMNYAYDFHNTFRATRRQVELQFSFAVLDLMAKKKIN